MQLNLANPTKKYVVCSLPDNPLLEGLGVFKNQTLTVKHKYPFAGPVVIEINNRNIAIANTIAKHIIIKEQDID